MQMESAGSAGPPLAGLPPLCRWSAHGRAGNSCNATCMADWNTLGELARHMKFCTCKTVVWVVTQLEWVVTTRTLLMVALYETNPVAATCASTCGTPVNNMVSQRIAGCSNGSHETHLNNCQRHWLHLPQNLHVRSSTRTRRPWVLHLGLEQCAWQNCRPQPAGAGA